MRGVRLKCSRFDPAVAYPITTINDATLPGHHSHPLCPKLPFCAVLHPANDTRLVDEWGQTRVGPISLQSDQLAATPPSCSRRHPRAPASFGILRRLSAGSRDGRGRRALVRRCFLGWEGRRRSLLEPAQGGGVRLIASGVGPTAHPHP